MRKLTTHELIEHPFVHLVIDHLNLEYPEIPRAAAEWIDDHRGEALPLLLSLVEDRSLLPDDALAEGFLPAIAAWMLGDLGDPAAVEPLLAVLSTMPPLRPDIDQWDPIWGALHGLGDCVIEPALRFYQRATTARARTVAATVLGDLGVDDPRVFDVLIAELPDHPCLISVYLARLGDARAMPGLGRAFDRTEIEDSGGLGDTHVGQVLLDIRDAILELGGELTPAQSRRYERAWVARYHMPPPPDRRAELRMPRIPISAATVPEFCRNALLLYTTMSRASEQVRMRPAELWHYACTRWHLQ